MEYRRPLRYTFPLARGEDVRAVQQALVTLKVEPPCGIADGVFGALTKSSVQSWQRAYNSAGRAGDVALVEDGVVGEKTWPILFRKASSSGPPNGIVRLTGDALPAAMTLDGEPVDGPPVGLRQAARVKSWIMGNFGDIVRARLHPPFDADLVCAIAGKETAYKWLSWTERMQPSELIARCVFDASGDYPHTGRSAFPVNTSAFRAKYPDLAPMLISEANETRKVQGWDAEQWVYKGYGIFQYDLQHILTDPAFFQERRWRDFGTCMDKLIVELDAKLSRAGGDLWKAVEMYNGSGRNARIYALHVRRIREWMALA